MRSPPRRKAHISWYIAWVCAGLLGGAALSVVVPAGMFVGWPWCVAACGLAVLASLKRSRIMVAVVLLAGVLLGLWRGGLEQAYRADYLPYFGQAVTLRGTITEDTVHTQTGEQRLRLGNVAISTQSLPGIVWVSSRSKADSKRGDLVSVRGVIEPGFGNLPASIPRATLTNIQRPNPGDVARRIRDWFANGVRLGIPEPQASLGIGYLTGQRSTLPEYLNDQLRMLGLTHVVVASGYNLTILVQFARRLLAGTSKYLATLTAGLMMASFVLITGLSPSMTRAAMVTALSLLAWYYGRTVHPIILLLFVAGVTILIDPSALWGDLGWYLSFLSFAGVILLAPLITHYFWGMEAKAGLVRSLMVETGSAQLATMPLIIFVFGQYSPLALPANILVLPLIPLAMALTFAGGVVSLLMPGIATWAGLPAHGILTYMTTTVDRLAGVPWASGELTISATTMAVSYGIMLAVGVVMWRKTNHNFKQGSIVE